MKEKAPKYYIICSEPNYVVTGGFSSEREAIGWALRNMDVFPGKKLLLVKIVASVAVTIEYE